MNSHLYHCNQVYPFHPLCQASHQVREIQHGQVHLVNLDRPVRIFMCSSTMKIFNLKCYLIVYPLKLSLITYSSTLHARITEISLSTLHPCCTSQSFTAILTRCSGMPSFTLKTWYALK